MKPRAVVLLSGGLDSATSLLIARERGFDLHAISFDYGQRHAIELECARNRGAARAVLGESNARDVAEARAEARRRSIRTLERRRADGDPARQRCEGLQPALGREQPLVDLRALVVDDEGRHEQS